MKDDRGLDRAALDRWITREPPEDDEDDEDDTVDLTPEERERINVELMQEHIASLEAGTKEKKCPH